MTLQQFYDLNETDKVAAIMEFGSLLAEHIEENKRIFIYRLDAFYVSTSFHLTADQFCEINCYQEINNLVTHHRKNIMLINPAERLDTPLSRL